MRQAESPIRLQDIKLPLIGVLSYYENVKLVLQELKNNFDVWSTMYVYMTHIHTRSNSHPQSDYLLLVNFLGFIV